MDIEKEVLLMNPGYLSFIMISITFIFIVTEWKDQLLGNLHISYLAVIIYIASWVFCSLITIQIYGLYQINLSYLLLIFITIYTVFRLENWLDVFHFITVGLLLGSVYTLMYQLVQMDPVLIVKYPYFNMVVMFIMISVLFIRQPLQQIAAITIGILVGDALFNLLNYKRLSYNIGNPIMYDQWWLICLSTRLLSEIIAQIWNGCKMLVRFWVKESKD